MAKRGKIKQIQPTKEQGVPLVSATVMSFPQPPLRKAEEYLEAYSGYAYTAVSAIAQEVASIQLKLYRVKMVNGEPQTEEIHEHKILSFLQFVNPLMTFYDMVEATSIYEELTGEAFWVLLRGVGNEPREAWLVRPDWIKVVPDTKTIVGSYIYDPGGIGTNKFSIPKENVIHFKYFNPKNPYRGKGSIQAAAMALDIHTFAQEWNRNFFFNSATPGLVFTTEQKISQQVIQRFMAQWKQEHGGRNNSQKVAFLGGGFKLDKTSMQPKDMDFTEQQSKMRDDILAVFKVPKTVLGLTEDVNRANAEATTRAFMERVITPRMRKFVGTLNEFLIPMFGEEGIFLDFEDPAPEDVEQKLKKYESGRKYGWLTANEIRVEENLKPMDGGDDLTPVGGGSPGGAIPPAPPTGDGAQQQMFTKFFQDIKNLFKRVEKGEKDVPVKAHKHMVPIPAKKLEEYDREELTAQLTKDLTQMIGAMLKEKEYDQKKKNEDDEKKQKKGEELEQGTNKFQMTKDQRDEHWRKFVAKTDEWESVMKQISMTLFDAQEKTMLTNLDTLKYWRKEVRKGRESSLLEPLKNMVKPWLATMVPFIREVVWDSGRVALDFLGLGGDLDMTTDPAVQFLREHATELMVGINETTREKLKKTLADGFEKGESIDELKSRVKKVFVEAKTSRTEKIARSEVLRASNFGTNEAYRQSGIVTGKEWLTALDASVCPACESMDGKIVQVDDNFFNKGDKLEIDGKTWKFDLFDVGYPPLHTSCRCTLIPVVLD